MKEKDKVSMSKRRSGAWKGTEVVFGAMRDFDLLWRERAIVRVQRDDHHALRAQPGAAEPVSGYIVNHHTKIFPYLETVSKSEK